MYYVYVLVSSKRKWKYIGCTDDLRNRFAEHNEGEVKSTKFYIPLKLVYYEAYLNKVDARSREYKLKHHSQTKELLFQQIDNSLR